MFSTLVEKINNMKKLLYTLFFGYLALKWRRLVRTLLLFIYSTFVFILTPIILDDISNRGWIRGEEKEIFLLALVLFVFIPITSYVSKPFVIKED
jgi:Na+/proline symporter